MDLSAIIVTFPEEGSNLEKISSPSPTAVTDSQRVMPN
jgi:hypothetical protein